ncbi:ABC transporter permease [Tissierella creatinini]|nr:ABC transporter permease [Tissierella creatinini]TJX67503.1 ABC transporter permease [Soehngenia saccharolytica]
MSNNYSKEHKDYIRNVKTRERRILYAQIFLLAFLLISWEVSARLGWVDTFITSSPSAIWGLFTDYVANGNLFYHIGISLAETIAGFVIGTIAGVIIATWLWWSNFLARVLDPYIVILNSLPKTALAPIFIILFGSGYKGIIITAISVSIVVTIMNMHISFKSVDEDKLKLLETFGASKVQILLNLIIPSSIPDLISTLKVNIGLSWVGVIVGEFLVSKAGLGYLIVYGMQVFRLDLVMMNVAALGFISALMYKIIAAFENKFTKWQK